MSDVGQFLFVTMDFGGNVPPVLGLVRRLAARGHTVRVLADRPLRARIASAGEVFKPIPSALEWDETKGRAIEDNLQFFMGQRFDAPLAEAVLAEVEREPTDVLAVDCMLRNAIAAAEAARLQVVEDDQAPLLRRRQSDPASIHGMTESQNSSGVTESQNYHRGASANS